MQPLDAFGAFLNPLEESGIQYFVTGSVASIFYGEPRLTHDIDIVIHLTKPQLKAFGSLFPIEIFYCPPEEVIQIESRREPFGHFNLIHHKSGLKADIYSDANDPLHEWAFSHRKRVTLDPTLSLWLAPSEYVVIRKLEYFREGGSTKHLDDIRKMLPNVQMDDAFLKNQLENRGLTQIWLKLSKSKI